MSGGSWPNVAAFGWPAQCTPPCTMQAQVLLSPAAQHPPACRVVPHGPPTTLPCPGTAGELELPPCTREDKWVPLSSVERLCYEQSRRAFCDAGKCATGQDRRPVQLMVGCMGLLSMAVCARGNWGDMQGKSAAENGLSQGLLPILLSLAAYQVQQQHGGGIHVSGWSLDF